MTCVLGHKDMVAKTGLKRKSTILLLKLFYNIAVSTL